MAQINLNVTDNLELPGAGSVGIGFNSAKEFIAKDDEGNTWEIGDSRPAILSVDVGIDERYNIQYVSCFSNAIYSAMIANKPIFMHVGFGTDILFLELTNIINKDQAIFGGWIDGEYHRCVIGNELAQCEYKVYKDQEEFAKFVLDKFSEITASIKDLDDRVTALEK